MPLTPCYQNLRNYLLPGTGEYQKFFLACHEELSSGVGQRPTRLRSKAEETSGEAVRKKLIKT